MMQIYLTTFGNLDFGRGAALAVMLSAASILISGAYIVGLRRRTP
jgi:ABC-type sugar transport system permease subunit